MAPARSATRAGRRAGVAETQLTYEELNLCVQGGLPCTQCHNKTGRKPVSSTTEVSGSHGVRPTLTLQAFDRALKAQHWNTVPKQKFVIPSSRNPLVNAARAIAVAAYPHPTQHVSGGRAERYSIALLAYIFRVSKLIGELDRLPPWVSSLKANAMHNLLNTGLRNLHRSFTVRILLLQ